VALRKVSITKWFEVQYHPDSLTASLCLCDRSGYIIIIFRFTPKLNKKHALRREKHEALKISPIARAKFLTWRQEGDGGIFIAHWAVVQVTNVTADAMLVSVLYFLVYEHDVTVSKWCRFIGALSYGIVDGKSCRSECHAMYTNHKEQGYHCASNGSPPPANRYVICLVTYASH
jgi:hypothetical protein